LANYARATHLSSEVTDARKIFQCPGIQYVKGLNFRPNGAYAYNSLGTVPASYMAGSAFLGLGPFYQSAEKASYVRDDKVRQPSQMIAIGDVNSAAGNVDISPLGPGLFYQTFFQVAGSIPYEWPAVIHNRGANMVFCDGHVEFAGQTNWMRKTEVVRRRWNNDNLPHPETW
jgi:prepilin-type processing-associated H-X9-DG protein